MRAINVIEVPASDMKLFDSSAYTDGAFFCQSSWARFFSNNVKYMGFYDNTAHFLGGFCVDHKKILFYNYFSNLPYSPYAGPFLSSFAKKSNISKRNILEELALYIKSLKFSVFSAVLTRGTIDGLPFRWSSINNNLAFTYIINLESYYYHNNEYGLCTKSRRSTIRSAIKSGVEVIISTDLEEAGNIIFQSLKRNLGNTCMSEINNLVNACYNNPKNYICMLAIESGTPTACVLVVHDETTACYIAGGHLKKSHSGSPSLLIHSVLKYYGELGIRIFDFEGSSVKGIEKFFRSFGGELCATLRPSSSAYLVECILKYRRRYLF